MSWKTHSAIQKTYHYAADKITDAYLISFPKSGRTWLRMLLAQAISLQYNLPINLDLYKMTLFTKIPNIKTDPRIGNYTKYGGTEPFTIPSSMNNKKIIFLIRDTKDTIVSYFFEWTKRRQPPYDKNISDFIREKFTLPKLIQFINSWKIHCNTNAHIIITYEDLHKDTAEQLKKICQFLEIEISDSNLQQAVANSKFDNMKQMESSKQFGSDHRFSATDKDDEDSYKMRKGKVGSYVNDLNQEDIDFINDYVDNNLLGFAVYKTSTIASLQHLDDKHPDQP